MYLQARDIVVVVLVYGSSGTVSKHPLTWCRPGTTLQWGHTAVRCSKIAEAEAAVSVNEKKWLVMHVNMPMRLDELRGPPNPWLTVT
jgi:hypothetical protein